MAFFVILLVMFIIICFLLCFLVLIQSDKGGGISGAIGGLSGANNFLGSQDTANVLTKGTYVFGGIFLTLCILMTFFAPGGGVGMESQLQRRAEQVTSAPASSLVGGGMQFADEEESVGFGQPAADAPETQATDGVLIFED